MAPQIAARARSERLESRENRRLKRFRAALRDHPEESASVLGLEGPRLVGDALRSGLPIEALLVSDSGERHLTRLRSLLPAGLRVLRTSDRLFAFVADTETPQGIAVLVEPRTWRLEDMLGVAPLVIVLVGVQDPGNVGTIVRAGEAFGASGVVACRGSAHPLAPKSVRASAGSVLRLPTLAAAPPETLMAELRRCGLRQYAATVSGEITPQDSELNAPCALWIGSEGSGLPAEIARAADGRIRIPVLATVESLNAAMAAAVLLYEAARQRAQAGLRAHRPPGEVRTQPGVSVPRAR